MKWKNIVIIITLALAAGLTLDLILYTWCFGRDRSENQYRVYRLSTESNPYREEGDYIFQNGSAILRYSLEAGEQTEYNIQVPEREWIKDKVIVGDRMYYALTNHTVRRFDFNTQKDEEIISEAELLSMCGLEQWPANNYMFVMRSRKDLLMEVLELSSNNIFICPIDGDLKNDWTDVNELFPKEDRTGREQEIRYRGIRIKRRYDVEKEAYRITDYWEEENGRFFVTYLERCTIKAGGRQIILDYTWGDHRPCMRFKKTPLRPSAFGTA